MLKEYRMSNIDELFGYTRLDKVRTGLNVTLFADSTRAYKMYNHIPLLFARNGYNEAIKEYIPFSIAPHSQILDQGIDLKINYSDVFTIQNFIRENFRGLRDLANEKIDDVDFLSSIRKVRSQLNEDASLLLEMSKLRPKDTNLPIDIWVDEDETYQGHAPRIKFQSSSEQTLTTQYSTMTITNPPMVFNLPQRHSLRTKDIRKIEAFVISNMDNLLKLAKGEIDIAMFKSLIKKVN